MHETFAALGDPNRSRIFEFLLQGESPVGTIAQSLHLSQSSASKHLKTLKTVGLVQVRTDAQSRVYSLNLKELQKLDAWLTPYRKLWANRLDALEARLDAEPVRPSEKGKKR